MAGAVVLCYERVVKLKSSEPKRQRLTRQIHPVSWFQNYTENRFIVYYRFSFS